MIKQQIGLGNWGVLEKPEVIDSIKNMGFDSMHVYEQGRKNIAVFRPEQIRSKFAQFDPKKKKSGNITAGFGAAALGAGAANEGKELLQGE